MMHPSQKVNQWYLGWILWRDSWESEGVPATKLLSYFSAGGGVERVKHGMEKLRVGQ